MKQAFFCPCCAHLFCCHTCSEVVIIKKLSRIVKTIRLRSCIEPNPINLKSLNCYLPDDNQNQCSLIFMHCSNHLVPFYCNHMMLWLHHLLISLMKCVVGLWLRYGFTNIIRIWLSLYCGPFLRSKLLFFRKQ